MRCLKEGISLPKEVNSLSGSPVLDYFALGSRPVTESKAGARNSQENCQKMQMFKGRDSDICAFLFVAALFKVAKI